MDTRQQLLDMVLGVVEELEGKDGYDDPIEWLDDQLSVETIKKTPYGIWKGAEILVAFGGPNIIVDTEYETVTGIWGTDTFKRDYKDCIGVDEFLSEMYS